MKTILLTIGLTILGIYLFETRRKQAEESRIWEMVEQNRLEKVREQRIDGWLDDLSENLL